MIRGIPPRSPGLNLTIEKQATRIPSSSLTFPRNFPSPSSRSFPLVVHGPSQRPRFRPPTTPRNDGLAQSGVPLCRSTLPRLMCVRIPRTCEEGGSSADDVCGRQ